MKLIKFVSQYGDGESVTYYRPADSNDDAASERADRLNMNLAESIAAYQLACTSGLAGAVKTVTEEVDA